MLMNVGAHLARSQQLSTKVSEIFRARVTAAHERFTARVEKTLAGHVTPPTATAPGPWALSSAWPRYWVDFWQRWVLFWDTLRQRGTTFVAHTREGMPPVLHFDHEMVLDARTFDRPVNYALVRIVPPPGVLIDPGRRPYVIIDPRAGHGPGIGGFKDDSQVGVALRGGHPVYFVIFFPEPEPGQTLLDVCEAERTFVHKVRQLHPRSPRPAIVGNCQGGWAAMMLAASDPDDTGPLVINGAPMSYWGGAWQDGEGDNPMRYAGGLLGGTWLASLVADLGRGKFDGAHLVSNFETLNPANTFWDKYYHVFANVDTEPPRFLEFERWWGGYYLMNREEIEWITKNLFVGNRLWSGDAFDLRSIKGPIVLFASMGDNITPPQQAFNWVADVYGSTDEIKARGQVIVGLLHRDIGHLGIFVSGRVAKKEHAQIVSVLESIERLPPGLYVMDVAERKGAGGQGEYDVTFSERTLEEVAERLNRFKRVDEKPFEAVAALSDFNQRAYELFAQPAIQAWASEPVARMLRLFHPLRLQRWAVSDLNPWLWWLGPAAEAVKARREAVGPEDPLRRAERAMSDLVSAWLDYYRDLRDATREALFFQVYGNMFSLYLADRREAEVARQQAPVDGRELPFVRDALASIADGGYPEAVARVGVLLARKGEPLPLTRLVVRKEIVAEYGDLLPDMPLEQWRRIRGEQEIIVRYEPERAIETLPKLVTDRADRERLLRLLQRLVNDPRVQQQAPTDEQVAMLARVQRVLGGPGAVPTQLATAG
jgi:pimeloyl-ACP methyl ester carboxylesterase